MGSRLRKFLSLGLAALLPLGILGCAMTGGDATGAEAIPKNVDWVELPDGDRLVGEIRSQEFRIQSPTLGELGFEKRHLETLTRQEDGTVRLVTRHGDRLQGKLLDPRFLLQTKAGADVSLNLSQIDTIHFAP